MDPDLKFFGVRAGAGLDQAPNKQPKRRERRAPNHDFMNERRVRLLERGGDRTCT